MRTVAKFVEKPNAEIAAGRIDAGYLWNSGSFMFRAAVLLDEYRNVDADSVVSVERSVAKFACDLGCVKLDPPTFGAAKAISIAYGVMEKTARAWCRWPATGPTSARGARSGSFPTRTARAMRREASRCSRTPAIVASRPTAPVALEDVDDLFVVATQDAVLVSLQKDAKWAEAAGR